jgi:glucokinase
MPSYLSVDIGGTKVAMARISVKGRDAKVEHYKELHTRDYGNARSLCNDMIPSLKEIGKGDESGLGISAAGMVDYKKGLVIDWTDFDSFTDFSYTRALGNALSLPVSMRNDAECFVMGEWAFGAGKKNRPETFVGIILGDGVGSCLLINGKPYKGAHGYAGEIGEFMVREKMLEPHASGGVLREISGKSGKYLYQLAIKGDRKALDAFRTYGLHAGAVIKNVVAAYDPEIIVLGGSVSKSFRFFEKSMMEFVRRAYFEELTSQLDIRPSRLTNAGLLGAIVPLLRDRG